MEKEKLFKILKNTNYSIETKIEMILSNNIDSGSEYGGMISVKKFSKIADDLIEYFKLK